MSMRTGFHSKEKNVKAIKGLGGLKKGGLKGKLPTKTAEPEAEKEPEKAKSPASAAPAPVASTPASKVSKPAASNDTAVSVSLHHLLILLYIQNSEHLVVPLLVVYLFISEQILQPFFGDCM